MDKPEFSDLWCIVGQLLILTHGRTNIKRGFSVNKQMAADNLCQKMFTDDRSRPHYLHWWDDVCRLTSQKH